MKKILITGITGQDGLFLTEKYLNENENHFVYGISRSNDLNLFYKKLNTLHVKSVENLKILNIDLNNRNQVFDLLKKINPQAVYNFSGPSSVYQSLDNKEGSISTIKNIFDNLMPNFRDSLWIDMTDKTPYPLRKNGYEIINKK